MHAKQILYVIYVTVLEHEQITTVRKYRFRITVKLCYSESGRPRHIFSLLPSSRYSQMMNLPRETKGNNLGTGAVDVFIQHACHQYHHMTICAACNVMGVALH